MLALPEQYKYARKRFADHRELILLSRTLESVRPLPDALATKTFEQTFLADDITLPRTVSQFAQLLEQRRAVFGDVVDRVQEHTLEVLRELRTARQKWASLNQEGYKAVREHTGNQLRLLAPEDFPAAVPKLLWPHLARFLKALARRLEKVPGNQRRDAELASKVAPALRAFIELTAAADRSAPHPELDRLQWMIEELRVSLFAQDLGTALPVSEKRIADQVEKAREEGKR
jgi:ATP-dependent helicase HrpA